MPITSVQEFSDPSGFEEGQAPVWICLTTQPKREHIAAAGIRARLPEGEVFCPRLSFIKKTVRGKVRFLEALFPGYLFVFSPLNTTRRLMESVPGVRGVVRVGGQYATVPAEVIDALKARFPDGILYEPDPDFASGATVSILSGPFANLQAVVSSRIPGTKRVAVLFEILGREVRLNLSEEELLPSDYRPRRCMEAERS